MKPPILRKYEILRGDFWGGAVINLRNTGGAEFWDGFVVRAQLRRHPDGALLHEFDLDPVVTEVSGVGILTLRLQMESADSEDLASGRVVGDVEVESDHMPKTTLVGFRAPLLADVTHPNQTPPGSSPLSTSCANLGMETLTIDVTVGPSEEVNITIDVGGEIGPRGKGYGGTSATALVVSAGSKTFVTQSGMAYAVGSRVRLASAGTAGTWMEGDITAYSTTSMTVLVDAILGAGSHADWTLSIAGARGATGAAGEAAVQRYFNGDYGGNEPPFSPAASEATADDIGPDGGGNHWIWNGTMWGPPFA